VSRRAPPPTPSATSATSALARLEAAAKQWERNVVIPHCAVCTRPCCALTDVVLDLSAAEAETLYRITPSSPQLPATVQASGGRFYAHGAPCPAFATSTQRCTIYDTGRKPKGCADFPVYANDDVVTADTRCEAVAAHLAGLEDALFDALVPGESLAVLRDDGDDDGTFVSFQVEGPAPAPQPAAPGPKRKSQPQGKPEPRERPPAPARGTPAKSSPWRGTSRPAPRDGARGTLSTPAGPSSPPARPRGTPGPAGPPGRRR
jgi:Fe-S-cluster containining protein